MNQKEQRRDVRYQLRHAAGLYWLIDMEQKGVPFKRPVPMNEVGAVIWNMLQEGQRDRIADRLCMEYQVSREQAAQDVEQFLKNLSRHGVSI